MWSGVLLRKRRFEHVTEVEPGDELRVGGVTVVATHAEHDADRGPLGVKAASLASRSEVCGPSTDFAGDTDLFDGMSEVEPDLDLARCPSRVGARRSARLTSIRRGRQRRCVTEPEDLRADPLGHLQPAVVGRGQATLAAELTVGEFTRRAAELAPEVAIEVLGRNGMLALD